MNVFMFPGQGSQSVGMGESLFHLFPEYVKKTDDVLGYSIEELCVRDPEKKLGQTLYTQPALYVVGVLTYLRRIQEKGDHPDWVLGHSVGEYAALFAAAAFDFESGLRLVKRRAELMAEARGGGMAAVLLLSEADVRRTLREAGLLEEIDVANVNSARQTVLAGPREAIERAKPLFERSGARYVVLNVSGAFHSRYMNDAGRAFRTFLSEQPLGDPRYWIVSNVDARPYERGQIRDRLADQLVCPVKWAESVRHLLQLGATTFDELGPGTVLTSLVAQIRGEPR